MDIYAFGDSNSWGAFDEAGGWVDRLKQHFLQQELSSPQEGKTQVFNLGVSGDTADDVANRIANEIKARQKRWSKPGDIYIVAVGVNDSRLMLGTREPASTPENYVKKLDQIANEIKKYSNNILFVGIAPVIDELIAKSEEDRYSNQRVALFDKALNQFCQNNSYSFFDTFSTMPESQVRQLIADDGLHLNSKGHKWMFEQVEPIISALLQK